MDGIGKLSRMLFGTAMNEDVEDLRDKFNQLASIAVTNNKAVNLNSRNLAKLEQHVNDLAEYMSLVTEQLNDILHKVENLYAYGLMGQELTIIENTVASLLHTNDQIIRNVVDAARGRVTSSLFPVDDFLYVLKKGTEDFYLKPLFDVKGIHHYYPLLESVLTSDAVIIHVPFKSDHTYEVYRVEPFPFMVNGTVMTLDLPNSITLINKDFTMYATGQLSDLDKCQTEYLNLYFCSASIFAFTPITSDGICEVVLTREDASKALTLCPYRELVPKPFFHTSFHGHHYFFFTEKYYVSVVCPGGSEYKEISGHFAILTACSLRSDKLNVFPEMLHEGFVLNITTRIFPIDTLLNLNFSSIKYVTTALTEFTFSNVTEMETALQDSLPVYLNPHVHFPTILIPIILSLALIIPLCYCVRKALSLYRILEGRVALNAEEQT